MPDQKLSDPLTMRLPADLLKEVEQVAAACGRSRSWVLVRALKVYLEEEGREIIEVANARLDVEAGLGASLDSVLDEVEAIIKGEAA